MFNFLESFSIILPLLKKTTQDSHAWSLKFIENKNKATVISFLNAHGVNTAMRMPAFAKFLMESDYLLRDGIGIKIAQDFFALGKTDNLNGTDLTPRLLAAHSQKTIAVFGASDEAQQKCCDKLKAEGFNVVGGMHGFHEDTSYIARATEIKPEILILCMGMPRQELLAAKLVESGFNGILICAGGWADFYSGHKPRAPEWVRKCSLEWFYRLVNEPLRLGKRYTIDLVYFFYVLYGAFLYELFKKIKEK